MGPGSESKLKHVFCHVFVTFNHLPVTNRTPSLARAAPEVVLMIPAVLHQQVELGAVLRLLLLPVKLPGTNGLLHFCAVCVSLCMRTEMSSHDRNQVAHRGYYTGRLGLQPWGRRPGHPRYGCSVWGLVPLLQEGLELWLCSGCCKPCTPPLKESCLACGSLILRASRPQLPGRP